MLTAFSLACLPTSPAQNAPVPSQNYDFKPGATVIFADDFKAAPAGEFPKKWEQQHGQAVVATFASRPALSLITDGISADRLTTKGFGDTVPLSPNDTPDGKANNRRVEFTRLN
jgi:hypothetical protein